MVQVSVGTTSKPTFSLITAIAVSATGCWSVPNSDLQFHGGQPSGATQQSACIGYKFSLADW